MFRIQPNLPAADYKTYQIVAPRETHYRPASCAEAECSFYKNGWMTILPETSTDLIEQVRRSGRSYTSRRTEAGMVEFRFEAGQQCFQSPHAIPLGRPELYIVRDGDWRGNPRGTRPFQHSRAADWVEDFAEHQDRLKTAIERG